MTATESGKLVKVKSTRHAKYQIAYSKPRQKAPICDGGMNGVR